jgi:hypothetical protein
VIVFFVGLFTAGVVGRVISFQLPGTSPSTPEGHPSALPANAPHSRSLSPPPTKLTPPNSWMHTILYCLFFL